MSYLVAAEDQICLFCLAYKIMTGMTGIDVFKICSCNSNNEINGPARETPGWVVKHKKEILTINGRM